MSDTGLSGTGRVGRAVTRLIVTLAVLIALLAAAAVTADVLFRKQGEDIVRSEILRRLPAGATGDVTVSIGGFSFLQQYLSGRFEQVRITGRDLAMNGIPFTADVTARGVPLDAAKAIDRADLNVGLDEDALNAFLPLPGAHDISLGDGNASYAGSQSLFGLTVGYRVTAGVSVDGDRLVFTPQNAELTGGTGSVDVSRLLAALAPQTIRVCVAQYLPRGVTVDDVRITPGQLDAHASVRDFVLSEESLRTLGSC